MKNFEYLVWLFYAFLGFTISGFIAFGAGLILLAIGCFYDIGVWGRYGLWLMAGGALPCLVCLYIWMKGILDE